MSERNAKVPVYLLGKAGFGENQKYHVNQQMTFNWQTYRVGHRNRTEKRIQGFLEVMFEGMCGKYCFSLQYLGNGF